MTIGGWIFMLVSVGFVVSLAGYCFYRVLTYSGEDHTTKPPDILGGD